MVGKDRDGPRSCRDVSWIERQLVALIGGLFTMVMFAGVISQIELPIVVVADVAFLFLLRWLWKRYPENLAIVGPTPVPGTPGTNAT